MLVLALISELIVGLELLFNWFLTLTLGVVLGLMLELGLVLGLVLGLAYLHSAWH